MNASVLIVDDEEMGRDTLEALLTNEGYDLSFAAGGMQALEKAKKILPDLILLDVMMPDIDGFEVCRRLRSNVDMAEVPIILVTSLDDSDSRMIGIDAGADDFISKPFDRIELRSRVRTITRLNRYRKILTEQQERKRAEREVHILSTKLLDAQEAENKRIAGELHDSLAQSLAAIAVGVENAIAQIEQNRAKEVVELLGTLTKMSRDAIEEVRRISMNLRPAILDDLGILATISWLCREFQAVCPRARIHKKIGVKENGVPQNLKTVIYRVLQESTRNITRHSNARHVRLALTEANGRLVLSVQDDGVGFNPKEARVVDNSPGGLGLISMKERVELSGGRFALDSVLGRGTTITASWPRSTNQSPAGSIGGES